jgi:hypothetical protein
LVLYAYVAAVFSSFKCNIMGAPLPFTIVSPVIVSEYAMASAIFNGPPMQIAVREVNELYRENFNLSLQLLISPRTMNCMDMLDNVQDIFTEYMYRGLMGKRIAAVIDPGSSNLQHTVEETQIFVKKNVEKNVEKNC